MATNWAGNITFDEDSIRRPGSLSEAQELIASSPKARALGSRHSFTNIATAPTIIDTTGLPEFLEFSADRTSVRVNGSMTYGRLADLIAPLGLALSNFASLPHISIAGAIATGTHGSGDKNQNLAASVSSVQLITGTGELANFSRGDEDFDGAVVSLGALGLVTAVTVDVEPSFEVAQRVYDGRTIEHLADNFDAIFGAGYSVSAFTRWDTIDQIWVKERVGQSVPDESQAFLDTLDEATDKRHPILELDAEACTDQLGVPGAAVDRLPHFKLDFTPSVGEELQSEFFVDRGHAADAIRRVHSIGDDIAEALLVSELRTVAADTQWMSPHVGRDSLAFHFTWVPDEALAESAARHVATALQSLEPRAHWGKVFDASAFDLGQYVGRTRFLDLVDRLDPTGTFTNDWFDSTVR